MARIYSWEKVQGMINAQMAGINAEKPLPFYRTTPINYKGIGKEGIRYTEEISEWLLTMTEPDVKDLLKRNAAMTKAGSVEAENHIDMKSLHKTNGKNTVNSNRQEERIAMRIMNQHSLAVNGLLGLERVGYQIPVFWTKGFPDGKMDLVFRTNSSIVIGELKGISSKETMLRAILEAMTYKELVDDVNLPAYQRLTEDCERLYISPPAILFFEGTQPHNDFIKMKKGELKNLSSLARQWDVLFFLVKTNVALDEVNVENNTFYLEQVWL